jgi:hypothetical protein
MKNKLLASSILVAGVCMFQNVAYANPYVFQFTESYDTNDNVAVFGTAANIKVTLDNGGASTISQAYTWNDIIGVSVQAVGGTFTDSWTSIYRITDTNVFLTTDVSGLIGTLSLGPSWANEYVNSPSTFTPGSYNQLGSGVLTALALTFGFGGPGAYIELTQKV